jgi:hypothetical protein
MNLPQLVAGLCGFLLLAAVGYFAISSPERVKLDAPTIAGEPVEILVVSAPPIGDFKTFNVNPLNPFVPFQERKDEEGEIAARNNPRPRPAVDPPQPQRDPYIPPKLDEKKIATPNCTGLISHESGRLILEVSMGDKGPKTLLRPGESVEGWQLIEISNGSAKFRDPDGKEATLLITPGATANSLPKASPATNSGTGSGGKTSPVPPGAENAVPPNPGPGGKKSGTPWDPSEAVPAPPSDAPVPPMPPSEEQPAPRHRWMK